MRIRLFRVTVGRLSAVALLFACVGLLQGGSPQPPSFAARYDYGDGFDPNYNSIAAADVNGDGIVDLVIATGAGIGTLLGNGDGTFRIGPTSNVGNNGGLALVPTDLNGDGKIDIITRGDAGFSGPVGIVVSFGSGDGTFQPGTFYQAGNNTFLNYIVSGDLNGDGILDAIAGTESGPYLFTGAGGGLFHPGVLIPLSNSYIGGPSELVAADVNGDGKLDLVAQNNGSVAVLLSNGNGTFKPEIDTVIPFFSGVFTVGDFNGDGKLDLLCGERFTPTGLLYLGNGDGTFRLTRQVALGGIPDVLASADLNGDGFLDLITGGSNILFGDGKGHFSAPVFYPIAGTGYTSDILPLDLRKDGRTDLVFAGDLGYVSVLLNNGKGKFFEGQTSPVTGGSANCAAAADFNGDGIADLAVGVDNGIDILLGTGKVASPYMQQPLLSFPLYSCPVVGDLNGDGIPDLLATSTNGTAVAYLGHGDGTFTQAPNPTPLSANGTIVLGDFNGDGKVDFALSSNLLAYGKGDGTFQTPTLFIPHVLGSNISAIAAGRLNSDNRSDIVLADVFANVVYVLISNGSGFTQTTFNTPLQCTGPTNLTLTDLNLDGNKDMLVGCSGGTVEIYRNNGSGTFSYVSGVGGGGPDFSRAIAADVNGDGILDLIIQGDNLDLNIIPGLGNFTYSTQAVNIGAGAAPGPVLAIDAHGQKLFSGRADLITPDANGYVNIFFNTTK